MGRRKTSGENRQAKWGLPASGKCCVNILIQWLMMFSREQVKMKRMEIVPVGIINLYL